MAVGHANNDEGLSKTFTSHRPVEGMLPCNLPLYSRLIVRWIPAAKVSQRWRSQLRKAEHLSNAFLLALGKRRQKAAEWNRTLPSRRPKLWQRLSWTLLALRHTSLTKDLRQFGSDQSLQDRVRTFEEEWRQRSGRRHCSIPWSLNDVMSGFWAGGLFKVAGDAAQMMSPLLVKSLIQFSQRGKSIGREYR